MQAQRLGSVSATSLGGKPLGTPPGRPLNKLMLLPSIFSSHREKFSVRHAHIEQPILDRLSRCISKEWRLQVRKLGLRRIRFHDLRHTHGSHMLASNVHPKIASERLGHSRVGITLDLYSHVVEGLQENAVALVDDAMAKALQKRSAELG